MNFMVPGQSAGGGEGGFYEDDSLKGRRPFSQASSATCSPSSSSSHPQTSGRLIPSSYLHHQQPQGPWVEGIASFLGHSCGGGGGASQLDIMMMDSSSPTTTNNNNVVEDADESDVHAAVGRGVAVLDSSSGGGGGGGEGNATASTTAALMIEKEHMFDKVVTPSDVGKLNRLVIPKQHAEKYFPLDSSTNEKGLLLNFEDRNGKPWRFRYSYWNSSQSYVMTKGWSRFVKEKKLDAGDIVSFQRGMGEHAKDRLFIDWRRRPDAPDHHHHHHHHHFPPSLSMSATTHLSLPHQFSNFRHPTWNHPFYLQHHQSPRRGFLQLNVTGDATSINNNAHHLNNNYPYGNLMTGNPCSAPIIYLRSTAARPQHLGFGLGSVQLFQKEGGGGSVGLDPISGTEDVVVEEGKPMVFESVPVVQGKAAAKRLRLFGVNMDCPISESSEEDNCDILVLPSTAVTHSTMPISQSPDFFSSSSPPYSISPRQLRQYNYSTRPQLQTMPSHLLNNNSNSNNKGKASMSLDLDI